jgi:hypothetical protein
MRVVWRGIDQDSDHVTVLDHVDTVRVATQEAEQARTRAQHHIFRDGASRRDRRAVTSRDRDLHDGWIVAERGDRGHRGVDLNHRPRGQNPESWAAERPRCSSGTGASNRTRVAEFKAPPLGRQLRPLEPGPILAWALTKDLREGTNDFSLVGGDVAEAEPEVAAAE